VVYRDPDGKVNLPVQTKYLMNPVYSTWGNENITGDPSNPQTQIRDGGCAITGVANITATMGFLLSSNPAKVNASGVVSGGDVQWANGTLANFTLANVKTNSGSFTHAIYDQQGNDQTREYATLVKVQYESTGKDHWVGVKGIETVGGIDYIKISPTSKNDYKVGANTPRGGQGWIERNGEILVPVDKTSAYVTFSRSLTD